MYWGEDWQGGGRTPRWRLSLITPPVLDPITVPDAKASARIRHDDEDGLVLDWIRAATRKVEQDTELALLTQTWDLTLSGFPDYTTSALVFPIRPVQSVTHVKYYDAAGALQTLAASNYLLDPSTLSVALAVNGTWPSDLRTFHPGVVRFVAGYTAPELVPEDLKLAIRLLVGHFAEQRQPVNIGSSVTPIDLTYDDLIRPYVRHLAA